MPSFNAQVFLSLPPVSKSWPDSVCAVRASKAVFHGGAQWRPVAVFQITSGAVDIKIAFIYWLLYVPTVAQITTLLSQDNRACVDLCCSSASGTSVHFSSSSSKTLNAEGLVCIWESENDNGMFAIGKLILQQENVNVLDIICWYYRLETFILEEIRTMALFYERAFHWVSDVNV